MAGEVHEVDDDFLRTAIATHLKDTWETTEARVRRVEVSNLTHCANPLAWHCFTAQRCRGAMPVALLLIFAEAHPLNRLARLV